MQGIFRKENTDKALKYGIYRHLPTYEKIIRNLVSFYNKNEEYISAVEKEFSYFIPYFLVDYRKWNVGGEYVEYNYEVKDENDYLIGRIEKRL